MSRTESTLTRESRNNSEDDENRDIQELDEETGCELRLSLNSVRLKDES